MDDGRRSFFALFIYNLSCLKGHPERRLVLADPCVPLLLFTLQHPWKDAGDGERGACERAPKLSRVWEKVNFCHTPGSD